MAEIGDYAWPKEEAQILKAVFDGSADAHMQRRAVKHIVEMLCGINTIGFDPESPHMTAFNGGRRWVARQIQNALTLPIERIAKEEPNEPRSSRPITATERAERLAAGGDKPAARKRARRTAVPAAFRND